MLEGTDELHEIAYENCFTVLSHGSPPKAAFETLIKQDALPTHADVTIDKAFGELHVWFT